jgi:hypothetical protein
MVGAQIKVSDLNERRRCRKGFAVKYLGSRKVTRLAGATGKALLFPGCD